MHDQENDTLRFSCSDENSDSSLSCEFCGCSGGERSCWTSYLEKQIYTKETKRYRLQSWYKLFPLLMRIRILDIIFGVYCL